MTRLDALCQCSALLRQADRLLRQGDDDQRAAWRLADAGALLRFALEEKYGIARGDEVKIIGLDEPTGRGVVLPRMKA